MRKEIVFGILGILIGAVVTFLVLQNNVQYNQSRTAKTPAVIDRHFIEQMTPHHEDAITMAELALEKSKRQEIRNLATDIKRTQAAEIEQMRKWYKDWFGGDVPKDSLTMGRANMHMGMMGDETDIERLENVFDFNKAFIEEMIPHHQMAVMMAQMLLGGTDREEMKKLAKNIIDAQTKEINDMRSWYQTWY